MLEIGEFGSGWLDTCYGGIFTWFKDNPLTTENEKTSTPKRFLS